MEVRASIEQTDVRVIPKDWEVKSVGGECQIVTKGTTPTSIGRDFSSSGINFLKAETINESGRPIMTKMAFIDEPTHRLLKRSQLIEGDILVSIAGVLGRIGIVERSILPANTNQALAIVRLRKESDLERSYLFYYLQSSMIQKQINDINVRAAQANISLQNVREFQIDVPPTKAEQTAIAAALSDDDALISNLEELIAKKQNIKQGAMQQLLAGKKRLPGFTGEWEIKELCEVAEFAHGRGLSKADLSEEGPYRCIHYGQLFTTYKELIREVKSRTNKNDSYFYSKENDVLMPTSDVTPRGLATASCIKENGVALGGGILIIRFHIGYDGLYFSYFVTQNRTSILKLVKGSTVFHLYAADLSKLEVCFPEHQEQIAISKVLSDMDAEIKELERKLAKYKMIKQAMMQELLTGKKRLI